DVSDRAPAMDRGAAGTVRGHPEAGDGAGATQNAAPMSKVVSINDLRCFQEKAERDLANWPTPVTSNTERAESDDGADSELGKREADARRAERKAVIQELNERHAVIENYGGKCVIACWDPLPTDPTRPTLTFQSVDAFRQRYSNRFVSPL